MSDNDNDKDNEKTMRANRGLGALLANMGGGGAGNNSRPTPKIIPKPKSQSQEDQGFNLKSGGFSGWGDLNPDGDNDPDPPQDIPENGKGDRRRERPGGRLKREAESKEREEEHKKSRQDYDEDVYGPRELTQWADILEYNDDHDQEWFDSENEWCASMYGEGIITVKYMAQAPGKVGYYCELCYAEMNAKKSLELHCGGMKHLKKKNLWERGKENPGAEGEDPEPEEGRSQRGRGGGDSKRSRGGREFGRGRDFGGGREDKDSGIRRDRDFGGSRGDRGYGRGRGDKGFGRGRGDRDFSRGRGDRDFGRGRGDRDFGRGRGDRDFGRGRGDRDFSRGRGDRDFSRGRGGRDFGRGWDDQDFGQGRDYKRIDDYDRQYDYYDRPHQDYGGSYEREKDPYHRRGSSSADRRPYDDQYFGRRGTADAYDRYGPPGPRRTLSPPPAPTISDLPPQDNLTTGATGTLLKKLASCSVKTEDDSSLATEVIVTLIKSLKEYNQKKGCSNAVHLLDDTAMKINIMKALEKNKQPTKSTMGIQETLLKQTLTSNPPPPPPPPPSNLPPPPSASGSYSHPQYGGYYATHPAYYNASHNKM